MTVQVLDLILVVFLAVSAYFAARRGFVDESLSIVGWVLAVLATLYFGPWAAEALRHSISPAWIATIGGYGLVFLAVLLSVMFLTSWISHDAKRSRMGPADGVLGALFGVVRGLVIAALVYLVFSAALPPKHQPDWITQARCLPVIRKTGDLLLSIVPNSALRRHLSAASDAPPAANAAPAHSAVVKKSTARPEPLIEDEAPVRASVPKQTGSAHRESVKLMLQKDDETVIPRLRPKRAANPPEKSDVKPPAAKHRKAGYGTKDREALERLIEENGKGEER